MQTQATSLNILTIGALSVAAGRVIDDSIVVFENIHRLLEKGVERSRAVIEGTSQMVPAITASTLTTVAVFLPLTFAGGLVGSIFTGFALTVTFALPGSLLVAVTVVPVLAQTFLKAGTAAKRTDAEGDDVAHETALRRTYRRPLLWVLRHRALTVVGAVVLLGGSLTSLVGLNTSLFPASEVTRLQARVSAPPGTSLAATAERVAAVEAAVEDDDGVEQHTTVVGSEPGGLASLASGGGPSTATIDVQLAALPIAPGLTVGDVAEVSTADAATAVTRTDGDTGAATTAVTDAVDELDVPDGVDVNVGGAADLQGDSFSSLLVAMVIAIALVYLTMVVAYSLVVPLVILTTLPLAAIGVFPALLATGRALDLPALLGVLMLIGIVVTDAIVLLERVQRNRRNGRNTYDALVDAALTRVRPILMTAVVTMLALAPLALGLSGGAILSASLATVVIGGLFSSTLLTLFVIPVVYSVVDGLRERATGWPVEGELMGWTRADVPDQHGRVAVVTGGNGGLGLETVTALAGAGAHVVMAAPEGRTVDGFGTTLGVDHLGHWALTSHLLPALLRAPAARVVPRRPGSPPPAAAGCTRPASARPGRPCAARCAVVPGAAEATRGGAWHDRVSSHPPEPRRATGRADRPGAPMAGRGRPRRLRLERSPQARWWPVRPTTTVDELERRWCARRSGTGSPHADPHPGNLLVLPGGRGGPRRLPRRPRRRPGAVVAPGRGRLGAPAAALGAGGRRTAPDRLPARPGARRRRGLAPVGTTMSPILTRTTSTEGRARC